MPFKQAGSIRYLTFVIFESLGIVHAVFSRQGGVSPAPWKALNVGGTVGDDPERVAENRRRSFAALNRSPHSIFDAWLIHSSEVVCADHPRSPSDPYHKADAILTTNPDVTLYMRFADCVPILVADPVRKVVGIIHAGWQGTVKHVARAAVETMRSKYGTNPVDVIAAIGPSIGAHHYTVGPEVASRVRSSFEDSISSVLISKNGTLQFDLWAANRLVLEKAGVKSIEVAEICTACHLEDWYSHRGEQGKTGRFGVLIALKD
jgi:polyphenol oxidase